MSSLNDTFKAWINKMPGSPQMLICIGEVEEPTTGWTVRLERAEPQGINPLILILDLRAIRPTGIVAQHVTKYPVRYEEAPPKAEYRQVTVRDGGDSVTIDVTVAS
jgi:hypothetical protein